MRLLDITLLYPREQSKCAESTKNVGAIAEIE